MITVKPNPSLGVPIYLQLMEQVKHAIETGALKPGDQLPGIRPLAEELVINANTVAKAYRELELEGLVEGRPGVGTFVVRTLAGPSLGSQGALRDELVVWLRRASLAGLEQEDVVALVETTLRDAFQDGGFREDVA